MYVQKKRIKKISLSSNRYKAQYVLNRDYQFLHKTEINMTRKKMH